MATLSKLQHTNHYKPSWEERLLHPFRSTAMHRRNLLLLMLFIAPTYAARHNKPGKKECTTLSHADSKPPFNPPT